jgi:hypothetical protein
MERQLGVGWICAVPLIAPGDSADEKFEFSKNEFGTDSDGTTIDSASTGIYRAEPVTVLIQHRLPIV